MKLNWGTSIGIFYGIFVLLLIVFVIKSRSLRPDMVADNYYEKDVAYQEHYEKMENTSNLASDFEIDYSVKEKRIVFSFPNDMDDIKGKIVFYRPSDRSLDFKVDINVDENQKMILNTENLVSGLWDVQVEWNAEGKAYYKEKKLYM